MEHFFRIYLSSPYSFVFSDARVRIFAWPRTYIKSSPVHRPSYIECWSRQHIVRTRVNKKILRTNETKISGSRGHQADDIIHHAKKLLDSSSQPVTEPANPTHGETSIPCQAPTSFPDTSFTTHHYHAKSRNLTVSVKTVLSCFVSLA